MERTSGRISGRKSEITLARASFTVPAVLSVITALAGFGVSVYGISISYIIPERVATIAFAVLWGCMVAFSLLLLSKGTGLSGTVFRETGHSETGLCEGETGRKEEKTAWPELLRDVDQLKRYLAVFVTGLALSAGIMAKLTGIRLLVSADDGAGMILMALCAAGAAASLYRRWLAMRGILIVMLLTAVYSSIMNGAYWYGGITEYCCREVFLVRLCAETLMIVYLLMLCSIRTNAKARPGFGEAAMNLLLICFGVTPDVEPEPDMKLYLRNIRESLTRDRWKEI